MTKVITLNGKLINIGEWDEDAVVSYIAENPYLGEGDAPEDWDFNYTEIVTVNNPLPEGAVLENKEIVESNKGRLCLKDDWESLRTDAYPSLKDQLDALWKGGVYADDMQASILSIKSKYPKPE